MILEEDVDRICDVGDEGRRLISETSFTSQDEFNPRRGRRIANAINDMFAPDQFAGKRILELGPGHFAFALLARYLGAEVVCVEREPAFVALGRHLGFEVLDQDFVALGPEQFATSFDGLWAKGVANACRPETDAEVEAFVARVTSLLAPDGWGWFISSNKTTRAPEGWDVEDFVAHRVEVQRQAFVGSGWTAFPVSDELRPVYALKYANSPYLFIRNLEAAEAEATAEDEPDEDWNGVTAYGAPDDPDPAYPNTDATLRFNKAFRAWQPHATYLDDPWGYFTGFVEIARGRGARFITMSQALAGEYDEDEINVLLDHHIDFYPLETEVMCRWELENGVVSSVYIFSRTETNHKLQKKIWTVDDLNIPFYQELERAGFEIGYHQNAVGTARFRLHGTRGNRDIVHGGRLRELSDDELVLAQQIFAEDVTALRKYFNIRTFIPHGTGEDNHQLVDIPEGFRDLGWVYNNTRREGERPPLKWRNFSDSSGVRPHPIRAYGGRYLTFIDKLHMSAHLLTPGLNHVLLHPGRYAKGMPYEKLGQPEKVNQRVYEQMPFRGVDPADLPLRARPLIRRWEGEVAGPSVPERGGKYYVISDDPALLRSHMRTNVGCIPTLLFHESLDAEGVRARKLPPSSMDPSSRLFHMPEKRGDTSDAAFLEEFRQFVNELHSSDIIKHLASSAFPADVVDVRHARITEERTLRLLARLMREWRGEAQLHLEATLEPPVELWEANIIDNDKLRKVLRRFDVSRSGSRVVVRSRTG